MTPKQLRHTLDLTLQEQNPVEYKRMKATGRLEPFLENLMGEYEMSVDAGRQSVLNEYAMKDYPNKIAELNSLFTEIEETALNQAVERITTFTEPAVKQSEDQWDAIDLENDLLRFDSRACFDANYRYAEKILREDKVKQQELADLIRSTRKPSAT